MGTSIYHLWSTGKLSTSVRERVAEHPVFIESGSESLFGVISEPTGANLSDVGVLIVKGAGNDTAVSRNHIWTQLAKNLAGSGFRVLRFHYTGTGDSSGQISVFDLSSPVKTQVQDAVRYLLATGSNRIVMVGSCYGARVALSASEDIPETVGLVLESTPMRDSSLGEVAAHEMARASSFGVYLKRALKPSVLKRMFSREWRRAYWRMARVKLRMATLGESSPTEKIGNVELSAYFSRPLFNALDRKVKVSFVNGTRDHHYRDFQLALDNGLRDYLDRYSELVEFLDLDGYVHALLQASGNQFLVEQVTNWIEKRFPNN